MAYDTGVTYTFTFTTQHTVIANGIIDIQFPSTVSITDSSAAVAGCQASLNSATTTAAACTYVSATQIKVTNLFTVAGTGVVRVKIPGIRNPRSMGTSSSFTISTTDSSGTLIDIASSGFTVTMTSVSNLQSATVQNTNSGKINGAFDPYQVFITPQTPTTDGDKVVLQFPTTMTFPTSSASLSCTGGSNVGTISCTMNSATKTITATISAFTGGSVASGTQFDFTINTLGNPISLAPTYMQTVTLTNSAGETLNAYPSATSILIQNTQAAALTGQTLSQSTNVASTSATYTFKFTPTNAIPQHAKIEMIYPSAVTVPTTITCTGLTGAATGSLDCTTSHNTAARTLTILNGFNSTTSVTTEVSFQIVGIVNPTTTTTSSFSLSTLTNSDYKN